MADPWRRRCPQGHASIKVRENYVRCDASGGCYDGEPVDAATVDEWPADNRSPGRVAPPSEDVLEAIVAATASETTHTTVVDRLPWRGERLSVPLADLHERDLITKVRDSSNYAHWRPTEAGRAAVRDDEAAEVVA